MSQTPRLHIPPGATVRFLDTMELPTYRSNADLKPLTSTYITHGAGEPCPADHPLCNVTRIAERTTP